MARAQTQSKTSLWQKLNFPAWAAQGRPRRLFGASAALALLVFTLSVFVPLVQTKEVLLCDWLLALSVAHQQGLRFGRDIIFTYGPLGFAWAGYHPATFPILLTVWAAAAVATWAALCSMVRRLTPASSRLFLAAGAFGVVLLAAGEHASMHDSRFFLLPLLLLFHHFVVDPRPLSGVGAGLVTAVAIAGLVKFSYLVAACIVIAAVTAEAWPRARWRAAAPLLLFVLLYFLGWLLAGQRLADFGPYLTSSLDVVGGYAACVVVWTPTELWDVLRFAGPALLMLALVFWAGRRQAIRQSLHVAALAAFLLLVFRAGYVRHDEHEIISTGLLLPAALLYLLGTWRTADGRLYHTLWIACVGACAISASVSYDRWTGMNLVWRSGRSFVSMAEEVRELPALVGGKQLDVAVQQQQMMQAARAEHTLWAVPGTVDLYTLSTHLLLANGLDYRPRPTLQSYAACTPSLCEANAAHLRGGAAPETVFFKVTVLGARLPTLEDTLSWLELARLYDVQGVCADYLVLRRSNSPRDLKFRQIAPAQRAAFKEPITLPKCERDAILWARVRLNLTAAGHLVSLLYKLPVPAIGVTLPGRQITWFRFLPASASNGFIISPLILHTTEFLELQGRLAPSDGNTPRPVAICISSADDSLLPWCYGDAFEVEFFEAIISTGK